MGIPAVVTRTPCALLGVLPDPVVEETSVDSTPLSGHARSVVKLEQVASVFYIAMVVTRLVGLNAARTRI